MLKFPQILTIKFGQNTKSNYLKKLESNSEQAETGYKSDLERKYRFSLYRFLPEGKTLIYAAYVN